MKNYKTIKHTNEPPGTLQYIGNYFEKTKIEVIKYNKETSDRFSIDNINEIEKTDSVQWINIVGLSDVNLIQQLGTQFNIHEIDLEDIVDVSQRSKIETKKHYIFSIFKMTYIKNKKIIHEHISMLVLKNMLITFQETPGDIFDPIRLRLKESGGQIRDMNVDYLYYSLIDCMIDQYYEISSFIGNIFSVAETSIIENESNDMDQVYNIRKELIYLKNSVFPIKDALNKFIKKESNFITDEVMPYFSDVMENLYHVIDSINTYREMVNSLYETQISKTGNDMNKTMMTLTIFSAIFIPLSFLAGVFGMNFVSIPGISSKYSFIIFMVLCVFISFSMLMFFKKRKWF